MGAMKASEVLTDTDLGILQRLYVDRLPLEDVCLLYAVDRRYIGSLLRRPQVQEFIKDVEVSHSCEYAALESEAIGVLRNGMRHEKPMIQQLAADKVLKVLGRYKEAPSVQITANEVKYVSKVSSDGSISSRPAPVEDVGPVSVPPAVPIPSSSTSKDPNV